MPDKKTVRLTRKTDQEKVEQALEYRKQAEFACCMVLENYRDKIVAALQLAKQHGLAAEQAEAIIAEIQDAIDLHQQAEKALRKALAAGENIS